MDISVIIVNYNTCQMTWDCIKSVFENTIGITFEIILVDNASTDGSKEIFSDEDRIIYIYNSKNVGFGRANNIGMKEAKGEYYFLLNSDTILQNNALKEFYDFAEARSEKSFYGCWLKGRDGDYTHSGDPIPTIKSLLWNLCKSYIPGRYQGDGAIHYSDKELYKIGYVTGADMFFHHSIFDETGGFDENFFMYFEESDWQRTAVKSGYNSFIIHGPDIVHYEGASQLGLKKQKMNIPKFRRKMKSEFYYVKKEYSLFSYCIYRIMIVILYMPKLLIGKSQSTEAIKSLFMSL